MLYKNLCNAFEHCDMKMSKILFSSYDGFLREAHVTLFLILLNILTQIVC